MTRYKSGRLEEVVGSSFKAELIDAIPRARNYARTLVKSAEDADDLVQEALEKALRSSGSFERGTNINAWLNKIIRNLFLDDQKSHRVSRTTLVGDDETGVMETNFSTKSSGDLQVEVSEVQDFVFTLPDAERSVVMLWAEGFSYEEIAEELGITRSNAGVILCRARKSLNTHFFG